MKSLTVLGFVIILIAGVAVAADSICVMKSPIATCKQGGWRPDDPPESRPPARTGVIEPDASTTWRHDETGVEVEWRGLSDGLYKIELYSNGSFVVQLSSWLEGVSSFTKQAAVSSNWGSGSGFQVKLIDDIGNEYWSDEFQIKSNVDVSFPNRGSCWSTGTTGTGVVWDGCQGNTVKCDIYRNGSYLDDFSAWVSGSGSYERTAPVPAGWGSGSGYSIHVMDDQGNGGFSEEFEIGNIHVTVTGDTVRWVGGVGAVKVELFDGDRLIEDLSGWIDNSSTYSISSSDVPFGMTLGEGTCRVRVSDSRDSFGWGGRTVIAMQPNGEPEPVNASQTQRRSSSASVSDYGPLLYVVVMGDALVYLIANSDSE